MSQDLNEIRNELGEIKKGISELLRRVKSRYKERKKKEASPEEIESSLRAEIQEYLLNQWNASNEPVKLRMISSVFNRKCENRLKKNVIDLIDLNYWDQRILKTGARIFFPKGSSVAIAKADNFKKIEKPVDYDPNTDDEFLNSLNEKGIGQEEALERLRCKKLGIPFDESKKYLSLEEERKESLRIQCQIPKREELNKTRKLFNMDLLTDEEFNEILETAKNNIKTFNQEFPDDPIELPQ